ELGSALLEKIIVDRERARSNKKDRRCNDAGKDFLDMLLDVLEDEKCDEVKITSEHVKALILDFLTAATDTTAVAIEWARAELVNNPTVLNKAQEEIDQVVGGQRLRGCPGLSSAMQELLAVLAAMIQCFEWKAVKLGRDGLVDMSERTGLTAPRAHDLVCAPCGSNLLC
ncbi:hypothetical protein RJ639_038603, partial [Escallonia herrerae]